MQACEGHCPCATPVSKCGFPPPVWRRVWDQEQVSGGGDTSAWGRRRSLGATTRLTPPSRSRLRSPPGPGSGLGVQSSLAGAGGVGSPSPEGRLRGCSSRVVLRGPGGLPRPAEVPPFLILQEARPLGILGDRLGLLRSVRLRALSSGPGNRRCVPWTQRAAPGNLGGGHRGQRRSRGQAPPPCSVFRAVQH